MNFKKIIENYLGAIELVALVVVAVVLLIAVPSAKQWAFAILAFVLAVMTSIGLPVIHYFQNHKWADSVVRLFIPLVMANVADKYLTDAYPEFDGFGTFMLLYAISYFAVSGLVVLFFKLKLIKNK